MSETKHTPLPWEVVYVHGWPLGIGVRLRGGVLNAFRMIGNTMGRRTKEKDKARCEADAQLIVTTVNARPKVEELLKCGREALEHISLYRTGIQTGSHCDMGNAVPERLVEAIREVEAALKGQA